MALLILEKTLSLVLANPWSRSSFSSFLFLENKSNIPMISGVRQNAAKVQNFAEIDKFT
jgi:hypothetical protein